MDRRKLWRRDLISLLLHTVFRKILKTGINLTTLCPAGRNPWIDLTAGSNGWPIKMFTFLKKFLKECGCFHGIPVNYYLYYYNDNELYLNNSNYSQNQQILNHRMNRWKLWRRVTMSLLLHTVFRKMLKRGINLGKFSEGLAKANHSTSCRRPSMDWPASRNQLLPI
jgi:hypothetical protein